MKLCTILAVALVAAATTSQAQTLEVAYPQASWLAIGLPVVNPDPEPVWTNPLNGNIVMANGGDTDDGDGDSILEFTPGAPGTFVKAYCDGGQLEQAVATFTGAAISAFRNNEWNGLTVNSNGAVILPIDDDGSLATDAWLHRVNPTSTFAAPSIDILLGSTAPNGPIDGTIASTINGNTLFMLQLRTRGIAETRITKFDTTSAPQANPALPLLPVDFVFLTQTELLAVMPESDLDALNAVAVVPSGLDSAPLLILVCGRPDLVAPAPASMNLYAIPVDKSAPLALYKSGASIASELAAHTSGYPGLYGFSNGGITYDPATLDIYLSGFDTETAGFFEEYDIIRLKKGAVYTAEVFKTEADIEADPAFIAEGNPLNVERQSSGMTISGAHMYITLETFTSNTDYYGRLSLPGVVTPVGDMNLDGSVDVSDVTLLGNAVAGIETLPGGANGDINGDTFVNSADVTALVAIIVP